MHAAKGILDAPFKDLVNQSMEIIEQMASLLDFRLKKNYKNLARRLGLEQTVVDKFGSDPALNPTVGVFRILYTKNPRINVSKLKEELAPWPEAVQKLNEKFQGKCESVCN